MIFKLPEWSCCLELEDEVYMSIVETPLCTIEYEIDVREYATTTALFFSRGFDYDDGSMGATSEQIGYYESVDAAKAAAEEHYNGLLNLLIKELVKQS